MHLGRSSQTGSHSYNFHNTIVMLIHIIFCWTTSINGFIQQHPVWSQQDRGFQKFSEVFRIFQGLSETINSNMFGKELIMQTEIHWLRDYCRKSGCWWMTEQQATSQSRDALDTDLRPRPLSITLSGVAHMDWWCGDVTNPVMNPLAHSLTGIYWGGHISSFLLIPE